MDPTLVVDERVDVVVVYRANDDITMIATPYKMRWRGRDILFTKLALRHPTAKGKRMIHVFDVTDGESDYRLEFDAERLTWHLVAVIASAEGDYHE